ncbi:hypothetical protein D9619_004815 [Psilocybe cf. subviscida]|uniref:AB hydrolase-1 domain-containing protein n=1 Tax=Psilocybe cf. subviscida TaxID=2480587 RepID=A0A8H5BRH1_9AGAR|nr:hypothetical protein D9619_004815 [Psilocybe cf. subviscida]
MSVPALKKYGCFSVHDSGAPHGHREYTTLIIFHGLGFHASIFDKLFSLLDNVNVRLVTANRPDYPGATPLTEKERMQLHDIAKTADQDPQSATNAFHDYIKENAKKTHDFLVEFISRESIPAGGGIILAGWSFGAISILGLLANANAVSSKEFDLRSYIKHVVLYGERLDGVRGSLRAKLMGISTPPEPPAFLLGYPPPPDVVNIFFDPSLTPGEALKRFPQWVSAYYAHREDPTKLEYEALDHPSPTILSMDPSDVQRCLEIGPALPGGSDDQVMRLGVQLGALSQLREAAIYLGKDEEGDVPVVNRWDDIEIKHVWCDRSMWEMPWAALCLQADLDDGKKSDRVARKVDIVRLSGANHFCHWDQPELALKGLLSGLDL